MKQIKENNQDELYVEEYRQAWDHFRHMENARTNYINFYFTALFAIFGLYTAIITLDLLKVGDIQIMIGINLLNIFSVFTLYIYINIVRIGWVLNGYSCVIRELRKLLYKSELMPKNISIRDYLPTEVKQKAFSIQYSAQILLKTFMLIINILIAISILIYYKHFVLWKLICLLLIWIPIIAIEIIVIINARAQHKKIKG